MQEQPTPMKQFYEIVEDRDLATLQETTEQMLRDGWQIVGPIGHEGGVFYHEMMKFEPDQEAIAAADQAKNDVDMKFHEAYDRMDARVRDLLEINGVTLTVMNGVYYTTLDGKTTEGINAHDVLTTLKKSKHYPVDLTDETVINAIEGLV